MVIAISAFIFGALIVICSSLTPRSQVSFVSSANNAVEFFPAYGPDVG